MEFLLVRNDLILRCNYTFIESKLCVGCAMFVVNFKSAYDLSVNEYYYPVNAGACSDSYVELPALKVIETSYPETIVEVWNESVYNCYVNSNGTNNEYICIYVYM